MSHKNKQTLAPLIAEMKRELHAMAAFGQSKHADKLAEKADDLQRGSITGQKIYSFSTMRTYQRHIIAFLRDMQKKHKNVCCLADCEQYVPEWISGCIKSYSPFTLKTELSALAKLYHKKSRGADRNPGQILDRTATQVCSEAVGHSRISVTAIYLTSSFR